MAYAAREDIEGLYDHDILLRVFDYDNDGVVDGDKVQSALDGATGIINSYLSAKHVLPLKSVPDFVRTYCIDIAVYRAALNEMQRTNEMRQRYEDAIRHLELIAMGKAGLGLPADEDEDGVPDGPQGATGQAYSFRSVRG